MDRNSGRGTPGTAVEEDLLREMERALLRALVAKDVKTAEQLHADDFQLINPSGRTGSKAEYLGGVASGAIDFRVWEPDSPIEVRHYGEGAVIRYRSQLEIVVGGQLIPLGRYWHTDVFEKRDGRWQVVWSQATAIQPQ